MRFLHNFLRDNTRKTSLRKPFGVFLCVILSGALLSASDNGLDTSSLLYDLAVQRRAACAAELLSPNRWDELGLKKRGIVFHYTVADTDESRAIFMRENSVSCNYMIRPDGTWRTFVPGFWAAHHAGLSDWDDEKQTSLRNNSLNEGFLGIEIVYWPHSKDCHNNQCKEDGDYCLAPDKKRNFQNEVFVSKDDPETLRRMFPPFPEEQVKTLRLLVEALQKQYPEIQHQVGHNDIAVGRKQDPGLAFPWMENGWGLSRLLPSKHTILAQQSIFSDNAPMDADIDGWLYTLGYRLPNDVAVKQAEVDRVQKWASDLASLEEKTPTAREEAVQGLRSEEENVLNELRSQKGLLEDVIVQLASGQYSKLSSEEQKRFKELERRVSVVKEVIGSMKKAPQSVLGCLEANDLEGCQKFLQTQLDYARRQKDEAVEIWKSLETGPASQVELLGVSHQFANAEKAVQLFQKGDLVGLQCFENQLLEDLDILQQGGIAKLETRKATEFSKLAAAKEGMLRVLTEDINVAQAKVDMLSAGKTDELHVKAVDDLDRAESTRVQAEKQRDENRELALLWFRSHVGNGFGEKPKAYIYACLKLCAEEAARRRLA